MCAITSPFFVTQLSKGSLEMDIHKFASRFVLWLLKQELNKDKDNRHTKVEPYTKIYRQLRLC